MRTGKVLVTIWGPWMWGRCPTVRDERAYVVLDEADVPSLDLSRAEDGDPRGVASGGSDADVVLACAREVDAALEYSDLAGALETVLDWQSGKWEYGGRYEELPATWHGDRKRGEYRPDDLDWLEIEDMVSDDPSDVWMWQGNPLTPEYFGETYRNWTREVYEYMECGPEDDQEIPDEVLHPYSRFYRRCRRSQDLRVRRDPSESVWKWV